MCLVGENCLGAHSKDELKEWKERSYVTILEKKIIKSSNNYSVIKRLREEYQESNKKPDIVNRLYLYSY